MTKDSNKANRRKSVAISKPAYLRKNSINQTSQLTTDDLLNQFEYKGNFFKFTLIVIKPNVNHIYHNIKQKEKEPFVCGMNKRVKIK